MLYGAAVRYEPPVRDRDKSIRQSAKYDNVRDWTTASNHPRPEPVPDGSPLQKRESTAGPASQSASVDPVASAATGLVAKLKGLVAKYSTLDWTGWAQCVVQYVRYAVEARWPQYNDWSRQKPADLSYGVIEYRLPSNCKILMIGDWGTHMTDNVALLRQALRKFQPNAIIHLGDVYYSGTRQECTQNVLEVMDALLKELRIKRPPFFTLPGNHDYYSGGRGFYEMIGRLNQSLPGCAQKASYFCLRTEDDHWQFLGMDTGYNDRDPVNQKSPGLVPSEISWHRDKLDHFNGTTVLLSHHQLFSAKEVLDKDGARPWLNEKLHVIFQPYYDRVAAWFWGHEHNLVIFKDDQLFSGDTNALHKGRLIGCSAYEETLAEDPYGINDACKAVAFMDNMKQLQLSKYRTPLQTFYDHAFALLEITPQQVTVSYYAYPSWDQDFRMTDDPAIGPALFSETLAPFPRQRITPRA
jgi:3',5'-cyclic AMP phosphodiesterase CpdA